MKRVLVVLLAVAALSAVIWVILESNEGKFSSYASEPETPAPQQSAGGSFTYNFDSYATEVSWCAHWERSRGQMGNYGGSYRAFQAQCSCANFNGHDRLSFSAAHFRRRKLQGLGAEREVQSRCVRSGPSGGLVFRLKDANNYYIVRANALEDNYRLYHVIAGNRRQFAGANFKVTSGEWHELRVECLGNKIICYYDGAKKIEATDDTFKDAGKVGLWTKADSVTYFDDLRAVAK